MSKHSKPFQLKIVMPCLSDDDCFQDNAERHGADLTLLCAYCFASLNALFSSTASSGIERFASRPNRFCFSTRK